MIEPIIKVESKIRLKYLDGLRGLAALIVFLYHVAREIDWRLEGGELPAIILSMGKFMPYGRIAVAIFIVLSGYCLMLPIAKSNGDRISGGLFNYFKRRARRILPPYYIAILFSLLLFAVIPASLSSSAGLHWQDAQPAFTPGVILSHLLLIHNLKHEWIYKIDGVMWTIAAEWQIYFFFPFLLLPVWKRFGLFVTIVIAFVVGLTPHLSDRYLDHGYLKGAAPWYLGLFALGMAGAVIGFSSRSNAIFLRRQLPWHLIGICFLTLFFLQRSYWENYEAWTVDAVIGAITTCLLIYCTQHLIEEKSKKRPVILHLLNSRWLVGLGSFSYSLYLVHAPLFGPIHLGVNYLPISSRSQIFVFGLIAVILGLVLSYLFHLAFERPFMHNVSK